MKRIHAMRDENKRKKILSLIEDPYKQLELKVDYNGFDGNSKLSVKVAIGPSMQVLQKEYRNAFDRIEELEVHLYDAGDISKLQYLAKSTTKKKKKNSQETKNKFDLKHLKVRGTDDDAEGFFSKIPLPYIPNLSSLYLWCVEVYEFPLQYGNLHKLFLHSCAALRDVSAFGNIYDLTLSYCNRITDISALNNNHTITILTCGGIKDYSQSFENSVNITIEDCWSKKAPVLSHMRAVRSLTLSGFSVESLRSSAAALFVVDAPKCRSFERLQHFSLSGVSDCSSVEALGSIPSLELEHVIHLSSLKGLGKGNRKVVIVNCHKITDFSPLRFIETVNITCCEGFVNASDIDRVKNVTLIFNHPNSKTNQAELQTAFPYSLDLTALTENVQHLTLNFWPISRTGFDKVPIIEIDFFYEEGIIPGLICEELLKGNHQKIVFQVSEDSDLLKGDVFPTNESYQRIVQRNVVEYIDERYRENVRKDLIIYLPKMKTMNVLLATA